MWIRELDKMRRIEHGWDGYGAPAPSDAAILNAEGFMSHLQKKNLNPSRVAPSVVGGVGITRKKGKRRVYVEFFNDGQVYALFSDNVTAPRSRRIAPDYDEYHRLIQEIQDYVDVTLRPD